MATSLSKKSVQGINAKCKNRFCFDLQNFMERGTKQLCRSIVIEEGKKLVKLTLWWRDEVICRQNQYGCTIREYTGNVIPELHCAVWYKCENSSFWKSIGLGGFHPFNEHPSPKRMINALCTATELVTDVLIISLLPDGEKEECRQLFAKPNKTK